MAYAHVTDHVEQALDLLLEQYKGKPRLRALLLSYVRRCQEVEDAIYDSILQRSIDNAVGVGLDTIGKLVGEKRKARADERYRVFLRARIRINRSHGRAPDIISVLRLVDAARFHFRDVYEAAFRIDYDEPTLVEDSAAELATLVRDSRSGGVAAIVYQPVDRDTGRSAFFGSIYDPALNADVGFSSVYDPTEGGLFGHAARA